MTFTSGLSRRAGIQGGGEGELLLMILGFLISIAIGQLIVFRGVWICAWGQLFLANFDCAVHTSPFMSNRLRVNIMGLKLN